MNSYRPVIAMALMSALLGSLIGCATNRPCTSGGCVSDAAISSQVEAAISQHPELEAPNAVRVQTVDQIVYLHGHVDTELERDVAESVARQVPNVRQVVDALRFNNAGG